MGLSLRGRVLILLTLVNIAVFAAVGTRLVLTFQDQEQARLEKLNARLRQAITTLIPRDPGTENVRRILEFPFWIDIEDSILVQNSFSEGLLGPLPQGLVLNPVGQARRDPGLDQPRILAALELASRNGFAARVAGGQVVPLRVAGRIWGACWFRVSKGEGLSDLVRLLLPWFLGSTAALVLASVLLLRGVVLDPLARLTQAARRMSDGDLSARALETGRRDEISELVSTFNGMAERVQGFSRTLEQRVEEALQQAREAESAAMIQRQLAAMGELAAGIAHEINNPLGGLINAASALRKDLPDERRQRYLGLLTDGLERIRTTVGQVLRMAPRDTQPVQVELGETVRDAVALVRHRAQAAGVELELPTTGVDGWGDADSGGADAGASTTVLGARNELGQVVLNLLVNAIDALEGGSGASFGGAPPRVTVRLVSRPHEVLLEVADNGPGAAPELLPRLRDPFFSTKEVGRGTGLGLSIVARVVDLHGGRLELQSALGEGFLARVRLPRQGSWPATEPVGGQA